MNYLILSLFVVVCVAAINDRGDEVNEALYDTDDILSTGLVFPCDCKKRKRVKYALKCDLTVTRRGKGYIVTDPDTGRRITIIPFKVITQCRCKIIIQRLKARC